MQIPWGHVRGVGTVDVDAVHPTAPWDTKLRDVTVFEVSHGFYEKYIHIDSALERGPGWDNTFIPHDSPSLLEALPGLSG